MDKLNVLDLYCGCGTSSHGLRQAGMNIVAGIDPRKIEISNYRKNFQNSAGVHATIEETRPGNFIDHLDLDKDSIDVIFGRPPCCRCNNEKKASNWLKNSEFKHFLGYIGFFKPKVIIFENPSAVLNNKVSEDETILDLIISEFKNYDCSTFKLNASDYSVPQDRTHIFVIGFLKNLKTEEDLEGPTPTTANDKKKVSVKSCLIPRKNIKETSYLTENGVNRVRSLARLDKKYSPKILDMLEPSYTITSRYWKDGYDALVEYGSEDKKIRRLEVPELRKIQTIPENFIIKGSKKEIIMQIGGSIPCGLITEIGKYVIEILNS